MAMGIKYATSEQNQILEDSGLGAKAGRTFEEAKLLIDQYKLKKLAKSASSPPHVRTISVIGYNAAKVTGCIILIILGLIANGSNPNNLGGIFTALAGLLFLIETNKNKDYYICSNCGNAVTKESRLCPTCKVKF